MKRRLAAATLGAVWSSALLTLSVYAQTQPAAPPAPAAAVATPAPAPAKPVRHAKPRVRNPADARVCLEFPTNAQVIQCSEKYRYAKAPG
ncbi:MAG TPA: hypothetical protein VF814_10075 [Casimicrobiaceae bacterium]